MTDYNYFGPLPLSAMGFIPMYHVLDFNASESIAVAADGNSLIVDQTRSIDFLNNQKTASGVVLAPTSYGCGVAPAWKDAFGLHSVTWEQFIAGVTSGVQTGDYLGDSRYGNVHRLYNAAGEAVFYRPSAMGPSFEAQGAPAGEFLAAFNSLKAGSQIGVDGGLQQLAWGYKADDWRGQGNAFYFGFANSIYNQNSGPGPYYNGGYLSVDLDAARVTQSLYIASSAGEPSGVTNYKNCVAMVFDNDILQENPYAANFSSNVSGGDFEQPSGTIFIPGLNTAMALYQDTMTGQIYLPRMAQDIYFAAVNSLDLNGDGFFFNSYATSCSGLTALPTRLLNSDNYALSIWQPGIPINGSMHNTALTESYPEMQLPCVGFYGSDGSTAYYNVLPFQFATLEITQGPDLLFVTPNGYVMAVYHSGNVADGSYSLWIGGTRTSYQSGVTNFRLPVQFGG